MNSLNNKDYCVICGKYISENNKMYCNECEEEILNNKEKRLDKSRNLWYNIFKQSRKK